jgi:Fe-S cluster biogenesis protein NfuA
MQVNEVDVRRRVESIARILASHLGTIELVGVSGGTVKIRFLGMCTSCGLKEHTLAATVRPALMAIPGVDRVEVIGGGRVSAEAERRLAALGDDGLFRTDSDTLSWAWREVREQERQ